MRKKIKKLKWLIANQEKLQELLEKPKEKPKEEKRYSLAGVPDYQIGYVNELLSGDKKRK